MSFDDNTEESWRVERINELETQLVTAKAQYEPVIQRIQQFKGNFGVREKSDGSIEIDFEKLVSRLPLDQALELRVIIDEKHNISGAPGEKPKVRVPAA